MYAGNSNQKKIAEENKSAIQRQLIEKGKQMKKKISRKNAQISDIHTRIWRTDDKTGFGSNLFRGLFVFQQQKAFKYERLNNIIRTIAKIDVSADPVSVWIDADYNRENEKC